MERPATVNILRAYGTGSKYHMVKLSPYLEFAFLGGISLAIWWRPLIKTFALVGSYSTVCIEQDRGLLAAGLRVNCSPAPDGVGCSSHARWFRAVHPGVEC